MKTNPWELFRDTDEWFRKSTDWAPRTLVSKQECALDWEPKANISTTAQEYVVRTELPDVPKDSIKVCVDEGVLTVSGERQHREQHTKDDLLHVESFYGSFARSFSLPDDADPTGIRAEARNGMLTIKIPRKPGLACAPLTIPIQTG